MSLFNQVQTFFGTELAIYVGNSETNDFLQVSVFEFGGNYYCLSFETLLFEFQKSKGLLRNWVFDSRNNGTRVRAAFILVVCIVRAYPPGKRSGFEF